MNAEHLGSKILSKLKEHGLKGTIVPSAHIRSIGDEISRRHRSGEFDERFYRVELAAFDFEPPEALTEFEAAVIKASPETVDDDPSDTPDKIEESGTGDVEGQIRLRWTRETESRPEVFSYFEAVSPQQRERVLIGTPDWELKFGTGFIGRVNPQAFALAESDGILLTSHQWNQPLTACSSFWMTLKG